MNKRITLWRKDKNPYGVAFAYENLKYIFPLSIIEVTSERPAFFSYQEKDSGSTDREGLIIVGTQVITDPEDINALLNYVSNGNQVFISAMAISDSLLHRLNLQTSFSPGSYFDDSLKISVLQPVTGDSLNFTYPGAGRDMYFSRYDSQYTNVFGRDRFGHPDFIGIRYTGGGAMFIQLAPMAFTNFFLLHKQNRAYYENALSYLPPSLKKIRWEDYFRNTNESNFSALDFIFKSRALRWAFWLLLGLFALVYIFESKRKQRPIPVIQPLGNASVDFVRTVGSLYYQQKNNQNLAGKMVIRFQEYVRSVYQLSTTETDETFIKRLAAKSGYSADALNDLVYSMNDLLGKSSPTDHEMMALQEKLELFYNH